MRTLEIEYGTKHLLKLYFYIAGFLMLLDLGFTILSFNTFNYFLFSKLPIGFASGSLIGIIFVSVFYDPDKKWVIINKPFTIKLKIVPIVVILLLFHEFSKPIALLLTGKDTYLAMSFDSKALINHGYFLFDLLGLMSSGLYYKYIIK